MTSFMVLVREIVNPATLLGRGGVWIVPAVIFAETGLFFGFFLPGDSLLLTVGILAAVGDVNLSLLVPLSILAAIIGDQLGYATGRRLGEALHNRFRFVRVNMARAREFYSKHGGKAVVLARFVPVVRTFAPIFAGLGRMGYSRFTFSNMVGAVLWVVSVTLAGYIVGIRVPTLSNYLNPLILTVIVSSPLVWMLTWIWGRNRTGKG
jgi:membrane-associated protein